MCIQYYTILKHNWYDHTLQTYTHMEEKKAGHVQIQLEYLKD